MLNEDRIKVMTRLAVCEKAHGKEYEIASRYYKNDYISYNMIWTAVMTTIAYALCLLLYFLLNFEGYMEHMHTMNLLEQGKIIIILYLCVLSVMLIISWFLYRRRYIRAHRELKKYCEQLHDLEKIYNQEHRDYMKQRQEANRT